MNNARISFLVAPSGIVRPCERRQLAMELSASAGVVPAAAVVVAVVGMMDPVVDELPQAAAKVERLSAAASEIALTLMPRMYCRVPSSTTDDTVGR